MDFFITDIFYKHYFLLTPDKKSAEIETAINFC